MTAMTTNRTKRYRITHNHVIFLLACLTAGLAINVTMTPNDGMTLLSKAVSMTLYWISVSLFVKFYRTRNFNVDEKISEHPIALALFLGCFVLGTALVAIFG